MMDKINNPAKLIFYSLILFCLMLIMISCADQTSSDLPQSPVTVFTNTTDNSTGAKGNITTPPVPTSQPAPTTQAPPPLNVGKRNFRVPIPTARINQAKQEWSDLLAQAKQKWNDLNIKNYDLKLSYMKGTWNPVQIFSLNVKDNQIVQQSNQNTDPLCCDKGTPYPTAKSFDARQYTITGLFDTTTYLIKKEWNEETAFEVIFDAHYGFPGKITMDSNRYSDIQEIWEVIDFKEGN